MDFLRKLFHEIVVKREGYSFPVEVAYEWMSDFCSHCQNIRHDVTACRRLYPIKETISPKDQLAKGKKQVLTQKATWVPMKENPSGIGSSIAFGATDKIVLELITVEEETKTIPEPQQIVPVQQSSEAKPLKDTLQLDNQNHEEEILDHIDATLAANQGEDRSDTPGGIPSLVVTHTSHCPIIHNNNFSIQFENVSDDIVAHNLEGNTISVLSPLKNKTLDISSIVAPEGSKIDSVLQKDLDFMHT